MYTVHMICATDPNTEFINQGQDRAVTTVPRETLKAVGFALEQNLAAV